MNIWDFKKNFHLFVEKSFNWIVNDFDGVLITKPKPGTFYNYVIKYKVDCIFIEIYLDRGQIFLDIFPVDCDDSFDLALVLQYLKAPQDDLKMAVNYKIDLDDLSALLKKYYHKIVKIFSSDCFSDTFKYLDYLRLKRTKEWSKEHFPKNYEDELREYESILDKEILDEF